ncbi:MAG: hypothetical protein WA774_14555 [Candidatus Acidiferrales bacterium]
MSKVPDDILALPLSERGQIALRVAVGKAIVEHALLGVPIYIGRDGKLVKLSGKELQAKADRVLAELNQGSSLP